MKHFTIESNRIEIYEDYTFTEDSADNVNQYDFVYSDQSEFHFSSVFGIKFFKMAYFLKVQLFVLLAARQKYTTHQQLLKVKDF